MASNCIQKSQIVENNDSPISQRTKAIKARLEQMDRATAENCRLSSELSTPIDRSHWVNNSREHWNIAAHSVKKLNDLYDFITQPTKLSQHEEHLAVEHCKHNNLTGCTD
ncbi:uncharacterized protein [Spinacia oleracea]|uniref:Uncharacterized protein n=1 Tax=Spinacia oleracea TaxID=3562 RepID=A0A9R0I1U0_SPIOL|nr:uncharacterized protein LOC110780798 [Spinacia oleracea]